MFDICYGNINSRPYVLDNEDGIPMPELPPTNFDLGEYEKCLTVDPGYYSAGITGEDYICLVFDFKQLK